MPSWIRLPWAKRRKPPVPKPWGYRRVKFKKPKPFKPRERSLTLPLPPTSSKRQKTATQSQSPLFSKLPAEIRAQIWEEALGGMTLRLFTQDGYFWQKNPQPFYGWTPKRGLLSVLLACRRSYSEAIRLLYSTNTFSFDQSQCLIYLDRMVLPHRIIEIRSIHFAWWIVRPPQPDTPNFDEWVAVWKSLAALPGLRKLKVEIEISYPHSYDWMRQEAQLLKPMTVINQTEIFQLYLSWAAGSQELPHGPYQISRKGDTAEQIAEQATDQEAIDQDAIDQEARDQEAMDQLMMKVGLGD